MKFCRDCKFYSPSGYLCVPGGPSMSWPASCTHPFRVSLVTGCAESRDPEWARSWEGDCQPDAILFEQRPPEPPKPERKSFWQRLFA